VLAAAERALALGDDSPVLRFLRIDAEMNLLQARGGVPDPDARRLANEAQRLINRQRLMREPYLILSVLATYLQTVRPTDLDFLRLGRRLYPSEPLISVGLAAMHRGLGENEFARRYLEAALLDRDLLPSAARSYTDGLYDRWHREDLQKKIQSLAEAGRYAEAVAATDELLALRLDPIQRAFFARHRADLAARAQAAPALP
jgi:tetratricopeptide (TPR) repeat protein